MAFKVLLADDEEEICDILEAACVNAGYAVQNVHSGEKALEKVWSWSPDCLITDLYLPGISGLQACRLLRSDPRASRLGIIVVSGRANDREILEVFNAGCDDFVQKPFIPREVVARIGAVIGRYKGRQEPEILADGNMRMNLLEHWVEVKGKRVRLDPSEFNCLRLLLEKPGQVLNRAQFLEGALGQKPFAVKPHQVNNIIWRLRNKLGPEGRRIETFPKIGYALTKLP